MDFPKVTDLDSPKKTAEPYLRKHYPEFLEYIKQAWPGLRVSGGVYLYIHGLERPVCPECGKPTPFLDSTRGFQKYCSSKCANSSPEFKRKQQETNVRKYGVPVPAKSKEVKERIVRTTTERYGGMGNAAESIKSKHHQTMLDKYGTTQALRNPDLLNKVIRTATERYGGMGSGSEVLRERIKETNLARYGAEHPLGLPEIREKIRKTNLERYGSEVAVRNPAISKRISEAKSVSFQGIHPDILEIYKKDKEIWYKCACPHPKCTRCPEKYYDIQAARYCNRHLDGTEPCTRIIPVIRGRNAGAGPEVFVRSVLEECTPPDQLLFNNRTLISPLEVDIYDPIHGLAFECNGCYWHSDKIKESTYHHQKYIQCQRKGVQLITIWEDWIRQKPEIVKSLIKAKYHIYQHSIYGRKCTIKEITGKEANAFYEANHIQGATRAQIHYGLFYMDKPVSAMSFSKPRGCMGSVRMDWELVRFCSLLNTQVIGAAGKLLVHFIREHRPESIVSFSSNDISNGGLYGGLGFKPVGESHSYWYIGKDYKRYHRSNFTKAAIIQKGWAPAGENWTETEAMMRHGFVRIYDSGQTKWELKVSNNIL